MLFTSTLPFKAEDMFKLHYMIWLDDGVRIPYTLRLSVGALSFELHQVVGTQVVETCNIDVSDRPRHRLSRCPFISYRFS